MPNTTISVTVTTPVGLSIAQLTDALCSYWGYQDTVGGEPNPQTKAQFVKARLGQFVKESYKAAKANPAADAARQSALSDADQVTVE